MCLALPLSCFSDVWQHEILRLGAVALTVRWSNMAYHDRCSTLCPQHSIPLRADYILWRDIWCTYTAPYAQKSLPLTSHTAVGHTTRNGDAVNDRDYIDPIRNGDAFDTTGYSDPFVRWKGHSGKVLQHSQVGGYTWHSVNCQPIHTE